jgi:hypothetical protein
MKMDSNTARMSGIAEWIEARPRVVLTVYAMVAAFSAYACMYAFRKPFTATGYEGLEAFTILGTTFAYKPIAVIVQLLGYMSSKFIGIKVASEATMARRVPLVLMLIGLAEVALLGFALVPAPWNLAFLFLNGLPLGMVWSLLFGVLEGRRVTEFLGLSMSVAVIFASGWVKGVGRWTMESWSVAEFWMPAVTGLLFIPLLLLSLGMLRHVPPPNKLDKLERTPREPMKHAERRRFFRGHLPGVILLVIGYLCLMTYRDLRDSFMDLILKELGHEVSSGTFAGIESWVGVIVIAALCVLGFFRNNRAAVWANAALITFGALVLGLATLLLKQGVLSPVAFYVVNGVGLYIAFVPYQSIFMDRLLASLGTVATASFLIAIADSYGYLSTVSLYLVRDIVTHFTGQELPWVTLLMVASTVVLFAVPLSLIGAMTYFQPKFKN